MITSNDGALLMIPAATAASSATQTMVFDHTGYEYANLYVLAGTMTAASETLRTIGVAESDTSTIFTTMFAASPILPLNVNTTTSTTYPNAMPATGIVAASTAMEFQLDLKARKKYIGIGVTPGTTTINIALLARLSRSKESADKAAKKSGVVNLSSTSATQCALVLTA